jgi:putative oxidoreductase
LESALAARMAMLDLSGWPRTRSADKKGRKIMSETMPRPLIPAFAGIYEACEPYALPLLRFVTGLILVPHGCQKLFGWFGGAGFAKFTQIFESIGYRPGAFWVALVALTELVGGPLLAFGFLTRFAAAAIFIFMLNAIWVTSAKGFFWTQGGLEYSLLIAAVALVFLVRGGGRCSIDHALGREL